MELLSEDPTYLVGGLGILAVVFLVAVRVTQQGKFLLWAMIAGGIALLVLAIDWIWVTDNERIESVVYELAKAVQASDADGVTKHLTPDIQYEPNGLSRYLRLPSLRGSAVVLMIKSTLAQTHFDFVRVRNLTAHAGAQTRRGTADFQIMAGGSTQNGGIQYNFGTTGSTWSFGFRETKPNVWQVERISPVQLPQGADQVLQSADGTGDGAQAQRSRNPDQSSRGRTSDR